MRDLTSEGINDYSEQNPSVKVPFGFIAEDLDLRADNCIVLPDAKGSLCTGGTSGTLNILLPPDADAAFSIILGANARVKLVMCKTQEEYDNSLNKFTDLKTYFDSITKTQLLGPMTCYYFTSTTDATLNLMVKYGMVLYNLIND